MNDCWLPAVEAHLRRQVRDQRRDRHVPLRIPDDVELFPASPESEVECVLISKPDLGGMKRHEIDCALEGAFAPRTVHVDQ